MKTFFKPQTNPALKHFIARFKTHNITLSFNNNTLNVLPTLSIMIGFWGESKHQQFISINFLYFGILYQRNALLTCKFHAFTWNAVSGITKMIFEPKK